MRQTRRAMCEAVQAPNMALRAVQGVQRRPAHGARARQGFVQSAQPRASTRIRGFLAEFGPRACDSRADTVRRQALPLERVAGLGHTVIGDLLSELHRLDERIHHYDRHVAQIARADERAQHLMQLARHRNDHRDAICGDDGQTAMSFKCGRQFAAWLGLTRGNSSGGKTRLGRITKAGDGYLRSLLILGPSVLALAKGRSDPISSWALALQERRGYWKAGGTGEEARAWPGRAGRCRTSRMPA